MLPAEAHCTYRAPINVESRRRLTLALGITAVVMLVELIGGWLAGSLALLADAAHMLADVAALSESGFHRLFRRHTRLTVSDYVAELRIGQACALLVNGSQPIRHIADEVGYGNLANFNRQFRALKNMTPRKFRQSFAR